MASEPGAPALDLRSLRGQVYDYLRDAMSRGDLTAGAFLNLNDLAARLGVSRTPLRDALLQLETEGFVTILPRRGCVVNPLTREEIRHLYQVIGALEVSVLRSEFARITPDVIATMKRLNAGMRAALDADDFDRYYDLNLELHDLYLELTANGRLRRIVGIMKQRLYDFPRKKTFVKEWEAASVGEHALLIELIEAGDAAAAADFLRDVHWSYEVQERFIERYYREELRPREKRAR